MPSYAENKKARFDYHILEIFEAGIALSGQEVKAVREGGAKLAGAFVTFHGTQALLTNASIAAYTHAGNTDGYHPTRSRVLLLSKKEIDYLRGKMQERGLTIIPLSFYTTGRRIKLEIAVAKGKNPHDKREVIQRRYVDREMKRKIKQQTQ